MPQTLPKSAYLFSKHWGLREPCLLLSGVTAHEHRALALHRRRANTRPAFILFGAQPHRALDLLPS
jgi:hypothetical protein